MKRIAGKMLEFRFVYCYAPFHAMIILLIKFCYSRKRLEISSSINWIYNVYNSFDTDCVKISRIYYLISIILLVLIETYLKYTFRTINLSECFFKIKSIMMNTLRICICNKSSLTQNETCGLNFRSNQISNLKIFF